jgi:hypothetical protein
VGRYDGRHIGIGEGRKIVGHQQKWTNTTHLKGFLIANYRKIEL